MELETYKCFEVYKTRTIEILINFNPYDIRSAEGNELPGSILESISVFRKIQPKGFIDVWWLYDDGGLTLLLPYIISTRHNWAACKLRVFCTASSQDNLDKEKSG